MIDTINPMNFDITKNLHGHVRVETRDRWTGRVVDSQEKDNLITNAVQKTVNASIYVGQGNAGNLYLKVGVLPMYEKLLGGLLLFDNTLTASASNYSFPSSAKLVGFAGQGADSTNPMAGSYNTTESVLTSNGFTTTWDFLTSQGNGTIASLARTSFYFPTYCAYRPPNDFVAANYTPASSVTSTLTSYNYLGLDETNHCAYIAPASDTTIGNLTYSTASIYKAKVDFDKISLTLLPPASQMTLIKTLTSSDGTTSARAYVYDKYNNRFVYITGTTIHLLAMDGTHTTQTTTGTSGTNFVVTENYYWQQNGTTVYRIAKSNVSNVQPYSLAYQPNLASDDNDIVFAYNSSAEATVLYPDGTSIGTNIVFPNLSLYSQRQIGMYYAAGGSGGMSLSPNTHYLGTIANLDSPVTKTSSQTMKITYTLTEA